MKTIVRFIAMTLLMSAPLWAATTKDLARANALDSQAAGYEQAAASISKGPVVKNLMAPNTAARYAATAKRLRQEAASLRAKP